MDNLWSVLAQTLALSVAAAVLLAAKRLFLDKLSPRWQYGVWAILALRALLPAGLLGRTLVPGWRGWRRPGSRWNSPCPPFSPIPTA